MAAFVTGGSGFIGGRLIERLVADGVAVRALARSVLVSWIAYAVVGSAGSSRTHDSRDSTPCIASRRCSISCAPRAVPPVAAKPAATRAAPSVNVIASRTFARNRAAVSLLATSRVPQRATSTRRATSAWSRANGTTQTGTPRSSALTVVPIPSWVTAHTERSSTASCETNWRTVALGGIGILAGTPAGKVATT
jgi:hypothetical protein